MASNFPSSLDSFTNPSSTDAMDSVLVPHATQHADLNDAVEALEAKVGADSSGVASSHDYKIAALEAVSHGKILQVVSTTKTDTFSASMTANSEADITGLSVTLTPSSASSKVFVVFNTGGARGTNVPLFNVRLYRDSTEIGSGDAAGSRETVFMGGYTGATDINSNMFLSGNYLDSPASTSALTYKLKVVNPDPTAATYTFYVNRTGTDSNSSEYVRFSSTITAFEVSA
jgi:hypothetical protein